MRLFALLLPLILATSHAHGAMRSVRQVAVSASAPASCPQATDNGCAAAPAHGSFFTGVSLLTSAQQSGQNSLLPTRGGGSLTLNIPGVDYGIGPDSTLSPQDPRTISDATCHYNNFGGSPTLEVVLCYGSGVVNYTLNNYDFSGTKIGKGPVILYLDKSPSAVSLGSLFTITNCYFAVPPGSGSLAGFGYSLGFTGNWNVVVKNNQFDGTTADLNSDEPFRDDNLALGTTFDAEYNAFTNVNTVRLYGGGSNSGVAQTFKFNFIQGLNDLNTTSHGEVSLISCGSVTNPNCQAQTIDHFIAEGNFIILNALTYAYCSTGGGGGGCVNTAPFFLSAGEPHQIKYTNVNIINNVAVTNTVGAIGGGPSTPATGHIWGNSLLAVGWSAITNFTVTGNWTDATGSTQCTVSGPASGSESVTASQTGNTLTITATSGGYGNNPIDVGWRIYHAGYTTTNITAFGTGSGNLGTYTVDGASQAVGSDSAWTVVPGILNSTLTGNYNLADPSLVGTPTSLGMTAPTMKPTNCLGAHN